MSTDHLSPPANDDLAAFKKQPKIKLNKREKRSLFQLMSDQVHRDAEDNTAPRLQATGPCKLSLTLTEEDIKDYDDIPFEAIGKTVTVKVKKIVLGNKITVR